MTKIFQKGRFLEKQKALFSTRAFCEKKILWSPVFLERYFLANSFNYFKSATIIGFVAERCFARCFATNFSNESELIAPGII
jgi:hypothetical protein